MGDAVAEPSAQGLVVRRADRIFELLRAQIATGELSRGVRLPAERDLASRFGVSVPTIREALQALAATGLVDIRHGSGSFVAPDADRWLALSLVTFLQLADVRLQDAVGLLRALDRQAIVLASTAATEEDVARLRAAVTAVDLAESVPDVGDAVIGFLATMAAAAHDRLLAAMARFLIDLVVRIELASYGDRPPEFWRDWVRRLQPYRLAVVEAIARHDRNAAAGAADAYHVAVDRQVTENPVLHGVRFSDGEIVDFVARRPPRFPRLSPLTEAGPLVSR